MAWGHQKRRKTRSLLLQKPKRVFGGRVLMGLMMQHVMQALAEQTEAHGFDSSLEPPAALGSEAPAPIQVMLQWLQAGGARWSPGLRVRTLGSGERGLVADHAMKHLTQGLLDVPVSHCLSADACLQNMTSIVRRIPDHLRDVLSRSHGLLHLCFLEHFLLIGNASFYGPYLNSLPTSLNHLPLLSALDLSSLLEGSQLLQDIEKHKRDLENLYEEICWAIPEFREQVSLANFMLTYCMVESHSHARHMGNDTMPLMVPLVDLINHRSLHPNLRIGWAGPDHLHVNVGREDVSSGSQLFFRYSDDEETSEKFFKQFGFVDEELPVGVKIQLPLRQHHPGYEEKRMLFDTGLVRAKMMILQQMQGMDNNDNLERKVHDFPKFVIWLCKAESAGFTSLHPKVVEEDLLPFARFVVFSRNIETLRKSCDAHKTPPMCNEALSPQEEIAARKFLLDSIAEHIAKYPITAAHTEHELLSLPISAPERPYVRIRRDEQRCLGTLEAAVKALFPNQNGETTVVTTGVDPRGSTRLGHASGPFERLGGFGLASAGLASGVAALAVCSVAVRLIHPKAAHTD